MFATIRRYTVKPGYMKEVGQKVQNELVPQLTKQPGFVSYHAVDAGNNVAISISLYHDRASADAANKAAAQWVQQHIAPLTGIAKEVFVGEVLASSSAKV